MPNTARSTHSGPSSLSVDISDILHRPGATKTVQFRTPAEGIELPLARVPEGSELDLDLRFDALVNGVHVAGPVRGTVVVECRRCLRPLEQTVEVRVDELAVGSADEAAEDDDTYEIDGESIDLEPIVRDAVVLRLPLHPLCREDCKGLCATCGADRNEIDCGHGEERIDVRWGELERLRRRLEG